MKACLLLDLQEDFFGEGPLLVARSEMLRQINAAVHAFRQEGSVIAWVQTLYKPDLSDMPYHMKSRGTRILVEGTRGAALLPELNIGDADPIFTKKHFSVCKSRELMEFLAGEKVREVTLMGINTHECILFSAIDLYQEGYMIRVPADCVWSYDSEAHRYALSYLQKRVHSTDRITPNNRSETDA
jgi:nicotinamidase-related amidase